MATDAMAQRRDRDRDRDREWILLGEQAVGFKVDRDVIRIGQTEDWYRDRAFRRLHLVVEGNDIHLINVRLVYFNGFGEDYRVDRLLREGEDQAIELRGDRSFVRQLELTYRARPGFGGRAVMKVYGEPSRRGPSGGPPPIVSGPGPGPGPGGGADWTELGCKQVSLFGRDRDSIDVGRREGRFKSIRLHVRGADVEMLDLRVIYANGTPDDIPVRRVIRQGDRTRPLDLRGFERSIDRVEMVYRTIPNFKGLARVCVEGLQ
ncbi:MAG: hypothetical protein M3N38_12855 [Pseudomonadota bacterium]|nr:hypothetical protein [Pseudomonadota bacterium]